MIKTVAALLAFAQYATSQNEAIDEIMQENRRSLGGHGGWHSGWGGGGWGGSDWGGSDSDSGKGCSCCEDLTPQYASAYVTADPVNGSVSGGWVIFDKPDDCGGLGSCGDNFCIRASVWGLVEGEHGFHIHEFGRRK